MKKEEVIVAIFGILLLVSIIMIGMKPTGYATTGSTTSNVTISTYFAIDMSINLSDGIYFGNVSSLPAINQNATHNYDNGSLGTTMFMNVSTDSNTNVDFCIDANDNLKSSGGDQIVIGNESYANATTTNSSHPVLVSEVALTTGYVMAGPNISAGSNIYYRFWLDVPTGIPSGNYNNTINFKGISTGGSCT